MPEIFTSANAAGAANEAATAAAMIVFFHVDYSRKII